jgi:AhpD family alkylhydroperoxidase
MTTARMVEYADASPEVRAVYDEIMATKGIDWVPNVWKTLGSHPPLLRTLWEGISDSLKAGRLDALTKEMIAVAVSATNGCEYCINSHTAAAKKLGMDEEMLGELMHVVGVFNMSNRIAEGYRVPVDPQILRAAQGDAAPPPEPQPPEPRPPEPRPTRRVAPAAARPRPAPRRRGGPKTSS